MYMHQLKNSLLNVNIKDGTCVWFLHSMFTLSDIHTSFLMPPCCRTVRRARLNLATLAMVSAAKHFRSLSGSRRIFTMVCRPPRSAMARRIWVFLEISFKIFSDPIYNKIHFIMKLLSFWKRNVTYSCIWTKNKLWISLSLSSLSLSGLSYNTLHLTSSVSSKLMRTSSPPTSRMASWHVSWARLKSLIEHKAMMVAVWFPPW